MNNDPNKKPRRRIKKVKAHGGHHGGAWKVAYADFVTAMMALFLVLWLVSQADTKLKSAIAQYFRSPGVFDTQRGGILEGPKKVSREPTDMTSKEEEQALFSVAKLLRKEFATRPEFSSVKDQIKIDVTPEGLRIQIVDQADRVSFASGSALLTAEAKAVLGEIAHGICSLPNPIFIGGHTDRRLFPPGSVYTNWELSTDRANAARRELLANCVKPEMVRSVVGYADTELLTPEDPYSPANRRISITVMRTAHPGAEERGGKAVEQEDEKARAAVPEEERSEKDPPKGTTDAPRPPREGATPPPEPRAEGPASGASREERLMKTKLANEGAVKVGEADKLPANATRSRETAPPRAAEH